MLFYFDESGDFAFAPRRYDVYAQAAVIIPDSRSVEVDRFVQSERRGQGCDELHAVALADVDLVELCEGIAGLAIQLCLHLTDTNLIKREYIPAERRAQAAAFERSIAKCRTDQPDEHLLAALHACAGRARHRTRMADGEFVQMHFLPEIVREAFQRALWIYQDPLWASDWTDFTFVFDGKLPGKLARSEKYLRDTLLDMLATGTRGHRFSRSDRWGPEHPYVRRFSETRRLVLERVFEHGQRFEDSRAHAGLQLADIVAHVGRRAVLEPDNPTLQRAYDALRPRMRNEKGACFLLNRFAGSGDDPHTLVPYVALFSPKRGSFELGPAWPLHQWPLTAPADHDEPGA